jgi:transposase
MALFWLSDVAWASIEPLLPKSQPGARRVDDRRVISGLTPASADEHRTRYMGGSERRHIRGMPQIRRSTAWRRKTTGDIA